MALLPSLRGLPTEHLVARRDARLVGAAGLVWRDRREGPGFPLVVEVLPAERRQGVGRRLVEAAQALISGESEGLWSHSALDEGSDAARFAEACGFAARRKSFHYRAEVARVTAYVEPLTARLRARGHVPAAARIVPLAHAAMEEVGWLVSAEFGGGPLGAADFLRASGLVDPQRSLAVLEGERVAAVILARWNGELPMVEAAVVAPAWRNGWANAVMLEAIAAVGVNAGAREFQFHCDEGVLATLQLAARTGAALERTAALYFQAAAGS